MSFDQRFQLTGRIADAIGQADHALAARQISSGRSVTIHLLAGGYNAVNQALMTDITALPAEYQVCFVETGDHNGTPYVITDALAGNPPLRQWLAGVKARLAAEKAANPNDLTRVRAWKIPAWTAGQGAAPPPQATTLSPPPPELPTQASVIPSGVGDAEEFSKLLGAIPAAAPAPQTPASSEPGEFTRMLRSVPDPAPSPGPTPVTAVSLEPRRGSPWGIDAAVASGAQSGSPSPTGLPADGFRTR